MHLAGQDVTSANREKLRSGTSGYAMVALLVSLSIMGVMLSVAMPVWKQMVQREKEAELVFRGQQYARAIGLFQRRAGPGTLPPNLDILVEQRFLRKKYKDPITGEDFLPLLASQVSQGPGGRGAPPGQPGGGPGAGRAGPGGAVNPAAGGPGSPQGAVGGIVGVVSKSKAKSIRLYNGRDSYDQWAFVFVPPVQAPGAGAPGAGGGPGQPGGPGGPGGLGGGPGRGGPGSPFGPRPGGPGGPGGPPPGPSPFPSQPQRGGPGGFPAPSPR